MKSYAIKYMLNIVILFCMVNQGMAQTTARMFPYEKYLTSTTKPPEITEVFGSDAPTGKDRYTEGGLVLTIKEGSSSAFAFDELDFSSEFGLTIEFEYAMYDGELYNGDYGDGLIFFLYEGEKDMTIGSWGAGLGYVYRETAPVHDWYAAPGMDGAFLGVGLDLYGDYKSRMTNPYETREGIAGSFRNGGRNHLTLRGANSMNNLKKGYPVLFTKQLDNKRKDDFDNNYTTATLDYSTGDYIFKATDNVNAIEVRPGRTSTGAIKYNRMVVQLIPEEDESAMYVSVTIADENNKMVVLNDFKYAMEFETKYYDNVGYHFKTKIPESFNIGFAAACGGANQTQAIKYVKVTLPYQAETNVATTFMCLDSSNKKVTLKPFDNDQFYSGKVKNPTSGNSAKYIDYDSFQFEDKDGFVLNAANKHYYNDPNVGTWEYFPATQEVVFTLVEGGQHNKQYTINYSALGAKNNEGPFGSEYYRSASTPIVVNTAYCTAPVNPNIRVK